ncbi:MAG: DUF1743 domain-containing protein [Thermoplasmatales archaeon]|nr:DUF1743 domain-containing protein [Thermoplasmatales archaeon]
MYVAVDDTDSLQGGCTTFLATEILSKLSDIDLIGNPRLVRLNPAVPWKTRGNGALVMRLGAGEGRKKKIGEIGGDPIFSYPRGSMPASREILERAAAVVERCMSKGSQAGLLVGDERPSPRFYHMGCTTIVSKEETDGEIRRVGALSRSWNGGRGLVGCVCAAAWEPGDSTYELLAYRERGKWGTERSFSPESVERMDARFPSTFNNWSPTEGKAAIFPSTPCPVLFGIRGDSEGDLPKAAAALETEPVDRWAVFLTNQGTDDHILRDSLMLRPNASYRIHGRVSSAARRIEGGHAFIDLDTVYGTVVCGIYEPAKGFRDVFDALIPGDLIEVMGEYREEPGTLNVEKLRVLYLAEDRRKASNPVCPGCGRTMRSAGAGAGYRCKGCGTKSDEAVFGVEPRKIVMGWYEPPETARRHLSKPLKRMGEEQPLMFVKRRNR